jgi:hypothetical protein
MVGHLMLQLHTACNPLRRKMLFFLNFFHKNPLKALFFRLFPDKSRTVLKINECLSVNRANIKSIVLRI